jgi:HEAT repeat protein
MKWILVIGAAMGAAACGSGGSANEPLESWLPMLQRGLRDENPAVRTKAVCGLERIGARAADAIPALECLAYDPDPCVRRAAAEALNRIQIRGRSCRAY